MVRILHVMTSLRIEEVLVAISLFSSYLAPIGFSLFDFTISVFVKCFNFAVQNVIKACIET